MSESPKTKNVWLRMRILKWDIHNGPSRQSCPDGLYDLHMEVPETLTADQLRAEVDAACSPHSKVDDIKLLN